jgi:succinoglycan biosynthesis protein ExoM
LEVGLAVLVVVLTFRRPQHITALVPLLLEQAAAVTGRGSYRVDVLVVDNDPAGTARSTLQGQLDRIRYVCEPRPGIAAARNRALAEAASHDVLVFIDDDERPSAAWLQTLLQTFSTFGSAAVAGPVESHAGEAMHQWVVATGVFDRSHRAGLDTGARVSMAASNNLLLDLGVVRRHGLRFAEWLGLSGGEDTLFTRTLTARGESIVWCAEAVVTEELTPERLTVQYVLRLCFSHGNTAARVEMALTSGWRRWVTRLSFLGQGGVRIAAGSGGWLVGLLTRSLTRRATAATTLCRGLGMLLASVGYRFQEYGR